MNRCFVEESQAVGVRRKPVLEVRSLAIILIETSCTEPEVVQSIFTLAFVAFLTILFGHSPTPSLGWEELLVSFRCQQPKIGPMAVFRAVEL